MINYKCDVKKVTFIKKVISMREFLEKTFTAKCNNDRE